VAAAGGGTGEEVAVGAGSATASPAVRRPPSSYSGTGGQTTIPPRPRKKTKKR
jgi:hypothetical protein